MLFCETRLSHTLPQRTVPRSDYAYCRHCGRHRDECGPLSRHRMCGECALERQAENIVGLATMTGHVRDRWARGMILSAGGLLPDRLQTRS